MKILGPNGFSQKTTYICLINEIQSCGNTFLLQKGLLGVAFLIAISSAFSANRHGRENETLFALDAGIQNSTSVRGPGYVFFKP